MSNSSEKRNLLINDKFGNAVSIGDAVIYISKTYCTAQLARGTVIDIVKQFGNLRAKVSGSQRYVESKSLYKI